MKNGEKAQIAKKWLERNRSILYELKKLTERRDSDTLANISKYEEGFTGGVGNLQEMRMIAYAERNSRIEELTKQQAIVSKEEKDVINNLEKDTLAWSLLSDRYIEGYEWNEIAKMYCYSEAHILRIHGYALLKIYPFIPKEDT